MGNFSFKSLNGSRKAKQFHVFRADDAQVISDEINRIESGGRIDRAMVVKTLRAALAGIEQWANAHEEMQQERVRFAKDLSAANRRLAALAKIAKAKS